MFSSGMMLPASASSAISVRGGTPASVRCCSCVVPRRIEESLAYSAAAVGAALYWHGVKDEAYIESWAAVRARSASGVDAVEGNWEDSLLGK